MEEVHETKESGYVC